MPIYQVTIHKQGEAKTIDMDFPDDEVMFYQFDMGNYSCDCNRGIFFGDYNIEDDPDKIPCGEGKYRVRVTRDGKEVYKDEDYEERT